MPRHLKLFVTLLCATALLATACGSDDGATVRNLGSDTDSSSSTGSSGSASSSAVSPADTAETVGDGGYEYASNVDSHRLVVSDICEIASALDAGDWATVESLYRDGANSVKGDGSVRTIAGFAAGEGKVHGLDTFYGTPTPLDDFITSALDGTGEFAGEPDSVRAQAVEKGIQNQTMVAWTVHELNTALAKANDGNFDIDSGAVHNWDEGWAFFHGAEPGCAPHATGNKRAGNFSTVDGNGVAFANTAILQAMIQGRNALLAEDATGAEIAAVEAIRNIAITYSQATIRYAHLAVADVAAGEAAAAREHQVEGYAFWRVAESILVGAGADGDTINNILAPSSPAGANGGSAEIRAALAPAWDALGITEAEIGRLESE